MNKKRLLIIILAVASLVSIVFVIVAVDKKSTSNKIPAEKPVLEQKYKGSYAIKISTGASQFNFPKELPLLEVESSNSPLSQDRAKKIASNLGFLGDPTILDDTIDGSTYFWTTDSSVLFVYANSGKIRFETGEPLLGINRQYTDTEILAIANNFLAKTGVYDDLPYHLGTIKYLQKIPNGEGLQATSKQKAILYQIGILPETTDYEIVSTSFVEPLSFIQLRQDGSVYMFQSVLFPKLQNSGTKYKLKSYDDIKNSLDEAVLVELRGNAELLTDMPTNLINSININNIEIAYLIETNNSTIYQPIYKLTGEATLNNSQDKYFATLYLQAISK